MQAVEDIQKIIEAKIRSDIYTMLPAKVTNADNLTSAQTVDVMPLVGRLYTDGTQLPTSEIYNVPIVFPAGGGALISLPVGVGDGVCLLFSMRDLDGWENSDGKEAVRTPSTRHHSVTDAVAIAGLFTTTTHLTPNASDVEIKFAGSSWKMKPNGNVQLDVAGDYIENIGGNKISNVSGTIQQNAPSVKHNDVEIGGSHTHSQGNDSRGDAQQETEYVSR